MVCTSRTEQGRDHEGGCLNLPSPSGLLPANVTVLGLTPSNNGLNTYTAIGEDGSGNFSTNSVTINNLGTNTYAYDQNGVLTNDGFKNFAYDDEDELIAVWVTNAWSNSFAYDGKMRRRIERDYVWNAGTSGWQETNEIHFIYDGNVVIEERNAGNLPLVSYTRGLDLSGSLEGAGGIGGLLARTTYGQEILGAPTTAFYHADGNGNITALMYPNQQLAAKYLYDPFGNMLAMSGPLMNLNKYRYSSKEWDDNSESYYYLYRFYYPNFQRWLNRDILEDMGFQTLRFSTSDTTFRGRTLYAHLYGAPPYQFLANNPIQFLDPYGLTQTVMPPERPPSGGGTGGGDGPDCGALAQAAAEAWQKAFANPEDINAQIGAALATAAFDAAGCGEQEPIPPKVCPPNDNLLPGERPPNKFWDFLKRLGSGIIDIPIIIVAPWQCPHQPSGPVRDNGPMQQQNEA